MKRNISSLLHKFFICGLTGWCMEILFTALDSLRRRDMTLKGKTSIWMFPIYGCAAILSPIGHLLRGKPLLLRGLTYMSLIFTTEYITGRLLEKRKLCPWNYSRSRWNIRNLIRLDYAPCWFAAGLMFERMLADSDQTSSTR